MLLTPPHPFALRPMQVTDLEQVVDIEAQSFPTPWPSAGYRKELTQNEQAYYVVLTAALPDDVERIIGYAGHWIVAGEAHVSTIAVHPQWRRRGLGALLLLQIVAHALRHGAEVVSLEVREGNATAQALYRQFGFVEVGRRRRYYKDTGEDAILMDLNLKEEGVREAMEARRATLWQRLQGRSI